MECQGCRRALPDGAMECPHCRTPVSAARSGGQASAGPVPAPPAGPLGPGERLARGRFEIRELLGSGRMGEVYLALDHWRAREVCLKRLRPELQAREDLVERLRQQVVLAREVGDRSRIVAIHDVLRERDGGFFFTMERLQGETLRGWLARQGAPVPAGAAVRIAAEILAGLEAAHGHDLIHRDLKPENVILLSEPEEGACPLKILDFGLVGPWQEDDAAGGRGSGPPGAGVRPGTPYYMAPEQRGAGGEVGPWTDIYAVGVILEEMLFGRGKAPGLRAGRERPKLPPGLEKVLAQALEKDIGKRIQTASEFRSRLKGLGSERWVEALGDRARWQREFVPASGSDAEAWGRGVWVAKKFNGFEYARTERFECGGEAHWVVVSRHERTGLEFVLVPGGTFLMGSPEGESERDGDEGPQHKVTIKPFLLCRTEVTQAAWEKLMGSNPSTWKEPDSPVDYVGWDQAQEWCQKAGLRLPSEAEWEYACRAGTTTPFSCGETIHTDQANYDGNYTYGKGKKGIFRQRTTKVGTFPPNAFGLYDMCGNIWEWCEDNWHDNYSGAPSDGRAWLGGASYRVYRGGSWNGYPKGCRSAYRGRRDPGDRCNNLGFRPAGPLP